MRTLTAEQQEIEKATKEFVANYPRATFGVTYRTS
jgi:hypothetical protein